MCSDDRCAKRHTNWNSSKNTNTRNPRNTSTTTAWKAVVRTYRTLLAVPALQRATARYSSRCTVTPSCYICANTPLAAEWQHHRADASWLLHRARGTHARLQQPVAASALATICTVAQLTHSHSVVPAAAGVPHAARRRSVGIDQQQRCGRSNNSRQYPSIASQTT